jgi:hypothetical protein
MLSFLNLKARAAIGLEKIIRRCYKVILATIGVQSAMHNIMIVCCANLESYLAYLYIGLLRSARIVESNNQITHPIRFESNQLRDP